MKINFITACSWGQEQVVINDNDCFSIAMSYEVVVTTLLLCLAGKVVMILL